MNQAYDLQRAENIMACHEKELAIEKQIIKDNLKTQKQAKSRYNHYKADAVFADIERRYAIFLPDSFFSSQYGIEYLIWGIVDYTKKYRNGSELGSRKLIIVQLKKYNI